MSQYFVGGAIITIIEHKLHPSIGVFEQHNALTVGIPLIFTVPARISNSLSSNDVTVEEGNTLVLTCNATGIPEPMVTWQKEPATDGSQSVLHGASEVLDRSSRRSCPIDARSKGLRLLTSENLKMRA